MVLKMNLLLMDEGRSIYDIVKNSPLIGKCEVFYSDNTNSILKYIKKHNVDVVLADFDRYPKNALSLIKALHHFDSLIDIILIGQAETTEKVVDMIKKGATDYLEKPVKQEMLNRTLQSLNEKKNLRKETFLLEKRLEEKYSFQGMIGKSPYMLEIFSLLEKISKFFSSILITGETGTGKELVAHAIHDLSTRSSRDLVICDCVSIPENLFESELFGYQKGAFTGASKNKHGLFQAAHKGIIFLDEIGEIPLSVQAKLLRVLENHQFRPLGSNETKEVDVKVIAATNRDLSECIENRTFRKDLFHRLNKMEVHLPPLRERKEDIPLLVRYFLKNLSQKVDKNLKGTSMQVQKLFSKYKWPGNVRELENVLERAALVTKKEFIALQDLPEYFQKNSASIQNTSMIQKQNLCSLEELEKDYITYLLEETGHNIKKTARILDVSRTTLYNKLKKYHIPH
ncbi:MAG: response regulator [Candidatus Aminicenantes bacterium]|nr:response regulator [Candidatus Aminicenantes bacterium]